MFTLLILTLNTIFDSILPMIFQIITVKFYNYLTNLTNYNRLNTQEIHCGSINESIKLKSLTYDTFPLQELIRLIHPV